MKIGIVTPGGFDRSGTERVTPAFLWLAQRLARRHEVHVYTLYQYPEPDEYELLGARIHNVGSRGRGPRALRAMIGAMKSVRREHRRGRFDVLHGLFAGESGAAAALAARSLGIPSVVTVGGGELVAMPDIGYGGRLRWKSRMMVKTSLRLATVITGASEFVLRDMRRYRADALRIILGAETSLFRPPVSRPGGPPWRLLHVANLNRVKDQPTLLRGFREFRMHEPRVSLDIIGEDTLNGEMQALAQKLGLNGAVTFHGTQTSESVAEAMRRSHLLLHSSRHEAGAMVAVEAAACGLPIVGTAVGHIHDLAPEAAAAVAIGDYERLGCAALSLLNDPTIRGAVAARALEWAHCHDADWTACQFERLYSELRSR